MNARGPIAYSRCIPDGVPRLASAFLLFSEAAPFRRATVSPGFVKARGGRPQDCCKVVIAKACPARPTRPACPACPACPEYSREGTEGSGATEAISSSVDGDCFGPNDGPRNDTGRDVKRQCNNPEANPMIDDPGTIMAVNRTQVLKKERTM